MPQEEGALSSVTDLLWIRAKSRWCIAVVHLYGMRYTTAELATHILCRYLQCGRLAEIPNEQIVRCSTAASLRIAMILNERYDMPRSELVRMGENRFSEETITQSELHISQCLDNGIFAIPTIESYVTSYMGYLENVARHGGLPVVIGPVVEELTCLAVHGLLFLEFPQQLLGLGIVVLALRFCQGHDIWEAQVAILYGEIGIEEGSAVAGGVSEVCARLIILYQDFPI